LQGKDEFSLSKNNKYNGNKRGWGAFPIFAGLRIPTPVFVRLTPGSFAGAAYLLRYPAGKLPSKKTLGKFA